MTAQHTPGKLTIEEVANDSGRIKHLCPVDSDGLSLLTVVAHEGVTFASVYKDEDARRLVACWNACDGLSTDFLEDAAKLRSEPLRDLVKETEAERNELLAVLMLAREEVVYMASGMTHAAWKTSEAKKTLAAIDAAIQKATKEQA